MDLIPDITHKNLGKEIFGPTKQIFIGSTGYPSVYSGPLTSIDPDAENTQHSFNPSTWVDLSLHEIIDLRYGLIRGKQSIHVKDNPISTQERIKEKLGEITLSTNTVEIEGYYKSKLQFNSKFDSEIQPMGPSGFLNKFELTSNPKIPKKVDSIIHDELKSNHQINELYSSKYDVYYLQGILSAGLTGLAEKSKIVPTRWSITAVDDMIGKDLIQKLKNFPIINDIEVKQGNLLGNYYTICLFPGQWCFENIESWIPGNIFSLTAEQANISIEREGFKLSESWKGRSSYSTQAGGYYASRFAILEYLHTLRKQAKVLIIREISPEYRVPVGVWQVREGIKISLNKTSTKFNTKSELINWLSNKLFLDVSKYSVISNLISQRLLDEFF